MKKMFKNHENPTTTTKKSNLSKAKIKEGLKTVGRYGSVVLTAAGGIALTCLYAYTEEQHRQSVGDSQYNYEKLTNKLRIAINNGDKETALKTYAVLKDYPQFNEVDSDMLRYTIFNM